PLPSRGCLFPPPPPTFALSPPSVLLLLPSPPPPLLLLSPPPPQLARRIASIISGASRATSRNRRVFIANLRRVGVCVDSGGGQCTLPVIESQFRRDYSLCGLISSVPMSLSPGLISMGSPCFLVS